MANRRFEIFHYRQIRVRLRQGNSDRDVARLKTMGRKEIAQVREVATVCDWPVADSSMPDDGVLTAHFFRNEALPSRIFQGAALA